MFQSCVSGRGFCVVLYRDSYHDCHVLGLEIGEADKVREAKCDGFGHGSI